MGKSIAQAWKIARHRANTKRVGGPHSVRAVFRFRGRRARIDAPYQMADTVRDIVVVWAGCDLRAHRNDVGKGAIGFFMEIAYACPGRGRNGYASRSQIRGEALVGAC